MTKAEEVLRKRLKDMGELMSLLQSENTALKRKAGLWDALLSTERIRVIGNGKLGEKGQHLGLELWESHHVKDSEYGKQAITCFALRLAKIRMDEAKDKPVPPPPPPPPPPRELRTDGKLSNV